jgi:hypothetical protein
MGKNGDALPFHNRFILNHLALWHRQNGENGENFDVPHSAPPGAARIDAACMRNP